MNVMRPPPVQPHVGESRWGSNEHAMQHQQPQLATSPSGSGSTDHMSPGKGSKAKDLSHVPCKFFRANTCTAGKACPFSHDLPVPGTTKPICQWFAKGNCKFGHKCALAHVLPGQPMSFDRKNKRAAQQALRDAQATANGGHLPPQAGTSPQGHQNGSGLTQTLRQSGDNTDMTAYYLAQREQLIAKANAHAAATAGANFQDGVFGSPDSTHTPATSPQMQGRGLPHEMNHAPLHFAAIARGATATFVAPPASGLSHHFGSPPSSSGRSTVAAQAMLSEQARRLSNTSDSLSPPRLQHLSRTRLSYNGGEYGTSPPLAVPGTNGGGGVVSPSASTGGGIFGTSPFSSSRGLFMPSSYDSNEDGFPRSPPMRHATLPGDGMYRTTSSGASWRNAAAIDDGDDDNGEDFDEGFLPSSLNDLLTPEEMRRRTMRAQGAHGSAAYGPSSVSSRNAFDFMSNSVPADLLLATGSPIASSAAAAAAALKTSIPVPSLGARSMSAMSPSEWPPIGSSSPPRNGSFLAQSRTREATLVAAVPPTINSAGRVVSPATASLLSSALSGVRPPPQPPQSPSTQQSSPHLVAPVAVSSGATYGMYSASFSGGPVLPSAAQLNGVSSTSPPTADAASTLHKSSSLASELAGIAAPGSLPTGLAAGLSRLHLVPPAHTGETPPSLAGSYFGSNNAAPAAVSSPFGGSHVAPPDSGVGLTTVGSPLRSELQHHSLAGGGDQTSSAAATSDGARRSSETASSGGRADDEEEHADEGDVEIQFDLEVA